MSAVSFLPRQNQRLSQAAQTAGAVSRPAFGGQGSAVSDRFELSPTVQDADVEKALNSVVPAFVRPFHNDLNNTDTLAHPAKFALMVSSVTSVLMALTGAFASKGGAFLATAIMGATAAGGYRYQANQNQKVLKQFQEEALQEALAEQHLNDVASLYRSNSPNPFAAAPSA